MNHNDIAIIGISLRFPDAENTAEFWENLVSGKESIRKFSDDELRNEGVSDELLKSPNYVKASSVLKDIKGFDASFYDISPKEAEVMDPQHRLLLELSTEVLEDAGIASETYDGAVGVFAGAARNTYFRNNVCPPRSSAESLDGSVKGLQLEIGNYGDFIATRVAYKLNLNGPAVNLQTACSTSLVAVHMAAQSILSGESDLAIAGGVSIAVPHKNGYWYEEGSISSKDGHCRAFDNNANGTVFGNGGAVVLLKSYEEAIADGDQVYAVIKGSAINNDGSDKVSYSAPSVDGQAAVIREALDVAGVESETISYIESHGTATKLGDPIEIEGLSKAFSTEERQYCGIGSVKTNVGHLGAAAGVAGLIKASLALKNKKLPPSINFESPNEAINFAKTPFYVNASLKDWEVTSTPRRAGVSSFGIGGTNAHLVLEEATHIENEVDDNYDNYPILLSAKSREALHDSIHNLADYLESKEEVNLEKVVNTLATGRNHYSNRFALNSSNIQNAIVELRSFSDRELTYNTSSRKIAFAFPGQGTQQIDMARGLYESDPKFKDNLDSCIEILSSEFSYNLMEILYPDSTGKEYEERLRETCNAQLALFAVEYSIANYLINMGITPKVMIGHSLGEIVAATISGVFTLKDALSLVYHRARIMQEATSGSMLAVSLDEQSAQDYLNDNLDIAAINGPNQSVIAGTLDAISELQVQLDKKEIFNKKLNTSHAFHSRLMLTVEDQLKEEFQKISMHPPQIPFVSNVTGELISTSDATDFKYWIKHIMSAVRFGDCVDSILKNSDLIVEVGPGETSLKMIKAIRNADENVVLLSTLPTSGSAVSFFEKTLGEIWKAGVAVNWKNYSRFEASSSISLPTYPFQRISYWQEPPKVVETVANDEVNKGPKTYNYIPRYVKAKNRNTILEYGVNEISIYIASKDVSFLNFEKTIFSGSVPSIVVSPHNEFEVVSENEFKLDVTKSEHWQLLLEDLSGKNKKVKAVYHCLSLSNYNNDDYKHYIESNILSLVELTKAIGTHEDIENLDLRIITQDFSPIGNVLINPYQHLLIGPLKVISQEYPHIQTQLVDVNAEDELLSTNEIDHLARELTSEVTNDVVVIRGGERYIREFERVTLPSNSDVRTTIKNGGRYLITGGMGGIGLSLLRSLSQDVEAEFVLVSRTDFPSKDQWDNFVINQSDNRVDQIKSIRNILANTNSTVELVRCDITDDRDVKALRDRIGSVNGIIHAAGVAGGGVIQQKELAEIERVLKPKVLGTNYLLENFISDDLEFVALCSSMSSIHGGFGQVDYCSANAYLDAFSHLMGSRYDVNCISIDWDAWSEVGMAVNTPLENKNLVDNKDIASVDDTFFERIETKSNGKIDYYLTLDSDRHWFLKEHRNNETTILPGTAYLDLAIQAINHQHGANVRDIYDVSYMLPCSVVDHAQLELKIELLDINDVLEFTIMSKQQGSIDWITHCSGFSKLINLEFENTPAIFESKIDQNNQEKWSSNSKFLTFGPRWNSVEYTFSDEKEWFAKISLNSEFQDDLNQHYLHPALLDLATGFTVAKVCGDKVFLPFNYGSVVVFDRLVGDIYVRSRVNKERSKDSALILDVDIFDDEKQLLSITDYTLRQVNPDILSSQLSDQDKNKRLTISKQGELNELGYVTCERLELEPNEVEIKTFATGLNFKEVLLALGMLPHDDISTFEFGLECSGVVTGVGRDVTEYQIGDEVMALGTSCFKDYVKCPEFLLCKIPDGIDYEQAATMPVAFITAYYSLMKLGQLKKDEKVLIHAAAGGVGMAAVQVAKLVGAEIYATCSGGPKAAALEQAGVTNIMNSRDLTFYDEILDETNGYGVDVVLNSLSAEFLEKSFNLLAHEGRFVEIGKRDILGGSKLDMLPFDKGITFASFNPIYTDKSFIECWKEVSNLILEGELYPLPTTSFSANSASDAFSYMTKGKHIGKVVISKGEKRAVSSSQFGNSKLLRDHEGISPKEGADIFRRILNTSYRQVLISNTDIKRSTLSTESIVIASESSSETRYPRPDLPVKYIEPSTDSEIKLAEIWMALIGIESVGRDDTFIMLGGDSLLATQVVSRIKSNFNCSIPAALILDSYSLGDISKKLDDKLSENTDSVDSKEEVVEFEI